MKISLGDRLELKAPLGRTMSFLVDPRQVSSCIPDSEGFKQIDEKNFALNVRVGIAFVSGVFGLKGTIAEQKENHVVYSISGSGIGSTIKITLTVNLSEKGDSTEVLWKSDSELSGLVSGVSETVIRKVTEDNITKIVANVKAKVEKGTAGHA